MISEEIPQDLDGKQFYQLEDYRRSGKTTRALTWILNKCLEKSNGRGAYVAVNNALIKEAINILKQLLDKEKIEYQYIPLKLTMKLRNGSELEFISRPEALIGKMYDCIVVDEYKKLGNYSTEFLPLLKCNSDCTILVKSI